MSLPPPSSGESSCEFPAAVGECYLNLFKVAVGQHFAGKHHPDRQHTARDRLTGEDLTLLVNTEMTAGCEIQVHARGEADATAGQAGRGGRVVEDLTDLLALSIHVRRDIVI